MGNIEVVSKRTVREISFRGIRRQTTEEAQIVSTEPSHEISVDTLVGSVSIKEAYDGSYRLTPDLIKNVVVGGIKMFPNQNYYLGPDQSLEFSTRNGKFAAKFSMVNNLGEESVGAGVPNRPVPPTLSASTEASLPIRPINKI